MLPLQETGAIKKKWNETIIHISFGRAARFGKKEKKENIWYDLLDLDLR
jgi:hypothetical protein